MNQATRGQAPIGRKGPEPAPTHQPPLARAGGANDRRLLRLAENVGNMGHWYADLTTGAETWSVQVYGIFGVDAATFVPHQNAVLGLCHPDDRAKITGQLQSAIAEKSGFEFDYRITRPDGTRRTIFCKGQSELDGLGRVVALFGVVSDVTAAFNAVRAIRDQNEMLDLAAHVAHLGHWVWSREDYNLSFCSPEMARIHDLAPGTFLRQFARPELLAATVTASHREAYRTTLTAALADARPYEIEYRIKTRAGAFKDLREVGHPILDADGKLARFIATVQDISQSKRRENDLRDAHLLLEEQTEALRRSEAKLCHIVEGSIQGLVVLRDFRPVFANQAYASLLGLRTPDDVLALGDVRSYWDDGAAKCGLAFWHETMASESAQGTSRRNTRTDTADGRTIWTDSIGRRIEWEGEPALLFTLIDVTERYLYEEELKQKTRELERLNLQKDKIFSIIAHDLRSPFTSIIGFADLLVTKARDLSHGQIVSYAQIVRESATGVHNLLDNLLAWAAFQIRDGTVKLVPLDLRALTASSLEPLAYMAESKGITISNGIGDIAVLGDESLVRIVIRNLVSNSIKFSSSGGIVHIAATHVAVSMPDRIQPFVRITVRDDGIGMSGAVLENAFELERTVSVQGTLGEKGTGLGLYLCRDIVKGHGGVVAVESTPGSGTSVHVTLPAAV